jgi:Sulfotransferase family
MSSAIPDVDLSEAALLAAASEAAGGLADFGEDSFRKPMTVLLDCLNGEAKLNRLGRFGRFHRTTQLLSQRLLLTDLVKRHPEIREQQIKRPLIITGFQRTGSTKLQRLLAADSRWHTPFLWEALSPAPLPGEPSGDPSMRIAVAKAFTAALYTMAPEAMAGHEMVAEEPEEETFAVEMSFRWTVPATFAHVPSYIDWVEANTAVPTYEYLKLILQALQWQRGGVEKPWNLKAPWHIGFLDAILEVFPDASIVQCHREPLAALASSCKLMYFGIQISSDSIGKHEHADYVLAMMSREMIRHLEQRDSLNKDPTLDVRFENIRGDALEVARKIYAERGWQLSAEAESAMKRWEANNPQHKHGKFNYSAKEFGLTRERVYGALEPYCRRFGFI